MVFNFKVVTKFWLIVLCFGFVTSEAPDYQALKDSLMRMKAKPNPGPNMDTVYIPGTPGGQWSEEEIRITRSVKLINVSK